MTLKIAPFFCIILQYKTHQKRHKMRPLLIQNNNDTHQVTHHPCDVKKIYPGSVGSRHIKPDLPIEKLTLPLKLTYFSNRFCKRCVWYGGVVLLYHMVYTTTVLFLFLHVRRLVQIFSQQSYRSQFRAGPCCANLEL